MLHWLIEAAAAGHCHNRLPSHLFVAPSFHQLVRQASQVREALLHLPTHLKETPGLHRQAAVFHGGGRCHRWHLGGSCVRGADRNGRDAARAGAHGWGSAREEACALPAAPVAFDTLTTRTTRGTAGGGGN